MSRVILRGEEALHFAEAHHLMVNEEGDDAHPARSSVPVEEARRRFQAHEGHFWVETEIAVHTGEPRAQPHH